MDTHLPWWAWALITWGGCIVLCVIADLAAPSGLWKVPTLNEKINIANYAPAKCNQCTETADQNYLAINRPDQCEAPHYEEKVPCVLADALRPSDPQTACKVTLPNPAQCYKATILEPQNTWSNFGYLLAGILILFRRPKRILPISVGINFCLLALFSGFYHASLQNFAQAFDVSWIYSLLLSLIFYAIECAWIRYGKDGFPAYVEWPLAAIPFVVGFAIGIAKANGGWHISSTLLFEILIGILAIPVLIIYSDGWWLYSNSSDSILNPGTWLREHVSCFQKAYDNLNSREWLDDRVRLLFGTFISVSALLCFVWKLLDGCGKPMCNPDGLQPHALWHIFGASALWWSYDFLAQSKDSQDTMVLLGPYGPLPAWINIGALLLFLAGAAVVVFAVVIPYS